MEEIWRNAIADSLIKFMGKVVAFLPNLLAMITILIVGFVVAWFVRILLHRLFRAIQLDKRSSSWGLAVALSKEGLPYSMSHLLSRFFYWLIVLVTLLLGINALELNVTQLFISQFFTYLPHVFAAVLILVVGYLLAAFLAQAALVAAVNAQMASARAFSRIVRWFIIILSLTMALYHLGIAEKVIIAAFSITFGGIILALAIAFGWGGKELAKNFLEKQYQKKVKKNEEPDHLSHL
jgi:Mechanosensitive ion channel, conserved TM helix